jgi:hypothetical protein
VAPADGVAAEALADLRGRGRAAYACQCQSAEGEMLYDRGIRGA